jgi:methylenetetrahydrofolate dehydrogenase (NADP+)/methenyltetrahydrofolate cyclohydrolase
MRPGQTIIDVGISVGPDGRVRGDADMEAAGRIAAAVTPVPGGVGAVTPYILALHTARAAAERKKL